MIDFTLTPAQKHLRANAQSFARNVLSTAPSLYSNLTTQTSRFQATLPIYQSAVSAGLIKGQVPLALGGTSSSLLDAAIVVEELHAVDPSAAITILGTGLGLTPLILCGSPTQQAQHLAPFLSQTGQALASFVHSEPSGTANWLEKGAPGLQTTAYEEGGEWIINGEKFWATNSSGWDSRGAELQCVVCRHGKPGTNQDADSEPASNILILLVTRADVAANEAGTYTVLSDPELGGHKAVNGSHTRFSHFRVPAANLLAQPGQGAQVVEKTFTTSAAMVGAMSVGIMRHAFEEALAFCKSETRGGVAPILGHQSVADRLVDAKMKIEAARALTWKAMAVLEMDGESVAWEQQMEIALEAKVWCSEVATEVVLACMAVVGMKSYAEDMPFSKLLEDAACLALFDGGNVGVRRRQLERILKGDMYQPWGATYPS